MEKLSRRDGDDQADLSAYSDALLSGTRKAVGKEAAKPGAKRMCQANGGKRRRPPVK
jgi:hypothetical protein